MNTLTSSTLPAPAMLIVLRAFGRYGRGDRIDDPVTVRAILDGGNAGLVIVPAPLPAVMLDAAAAGH